MQPRAGIYRELWERADRPPWLAGKRRAMWDAEAATLADPAVRVWVAISRFMREQIVRHADRSAAEVPVIRNGAPPMPARPATRTRGEQRVEWGVPDEAIVLLFAGADVRRKGLDTLAEAWPIVRGVCPSAWWVALGPKRRAHEAEARFAWLPLTDDMPAAFGAADALVLPSRYDPASKIVAEALHAGVPVITTRTNGACDLLEHTPAGQVLDDAGNAGALALAMLRFCDPRRLASAKAATRRVAAGATMDEHVGKLLRVLEAAAA